jgi:hypothetical protein
MRRVRKHGANHAVVGESEFCGYALAAQVGKVSLDALGEGVDGADEEEDAPLAHVLGKGRELGECPRHGDVGVGWV